MTIQENAPDVTGDANVTLTGNALTANLGTAAVANDTLIKKVDELTEEVDTIKSEKQRLTDTVEDMTKQLSSVGAEKAKWQALLNEVVSANNKLGKKIEHNKKKIASLADELGKMAGVKADLESMLQKKGQRTEERGDIIIINKELRATRSGLKDIASQLQDSNARAKKFEVEYKAGLEQKELLELVITQKDKVATQIMQNFWIINAETWRHTIQNSYSAMTISI